MKAQILIVCMRVCANLHACVCVCVHVCMWCVACGSSIATEEPQLSKIQDFQKLKFTDRCIEVSSCC